MSRVHYLSNVGSLFSKQKNMDFVLEKIGPFSSNDQNDLDGDFDC
jgi:hypothetical protein